MDPLIPFWLWGVFAVIIVVMLAIDLLLVGGARQH